jgi:GNAT superfamily N-acetyltransferase
MATYHRRMVELRIVAVDDDETVRDWQRIHNEIIPTHVLSIDDVQERKQRHHLEVAYAGDEAVGNSTVRPPTDDEPAATVIARVLPAHRGAGTGTALYERALTRARETRAASIETVVLASNVEGLHFAERKGFVEFERYLLPGDTVEYVTLRLR